MAATCNAINFTSSVSSLGTFLLRPYSEELELYLEPWDLDLDRDLSLGGDLREDLLRDLRGDLDGLLDLSGDLDSDRRLLSPRPREPSGTGRFGGSGGLGGGDPFGGGGGESDFFEVDFPAMIQ